MSQPEAAAAQGGMKTAPKRKNRRHLRWDKPSDRSDDASVASRNALLFACAEAAKEEDIGAWLQPYGLRRTKSGDKSPGTHFFERVTAAVQGTPAGVFFLIEGDSM